MRIISSFKDYYDSCLAYGADTKLVYVRNTEERYYNKTDLGPLSRILDMVQIMPAIEGDINLSRGVIVFCGRAYPFWDYEGTSYYSFDKLYKAISNLAAVRGEHNATLSHRNTLSKLNNPVKYGAAAYNLSRATAKRFFLNVDLNVSDDSLIFVKAPVFLIEPFSAHRNWCGYITINPSLRRYNFASEVDPYTAFQEISMYMGNNLATQMDPNINISDKLKSESKGFDKWSFRTHPDDAKKKR